MDWPNACPLFLCLSLWCIFTSRMTANENNMLNGGVSFIDCYYLIWALLFFFLGGVFAYYNHYPLPKSNKVKIAFEEKYASKKNSVHQILITIFKSEKIRLFTQSLISMQIPDINYDGKSKI